MTRSSFPRALIFVLLSASAFSGGCPGGPNGPAKSFEFEIDPQVKPVEEKRVGKGGVARPVAAVADDEGTTTSFIANEILIRPKNKQELEAFLARVGGTVVDTDGLPAKVNGIEIPEKFRVPTTYTVRVDASAFKLDNFKTDMEAGLDVGGESRISSDLGARLLAMIASEGAKGLDVAPNLALTPAVTYFDVAFEHPTGTPGFFNNGFWQVPHNWDATGSNAGMAAAWSTLALHDVTRRVRLAVIDGGFFLDAAGMPMVTGVGGVSDVAVPAGMTLPLQWDTLDDDGTAGGANPASCSGGSGCPWHGTDAVMTAAAIVNNQFGVGGSGGMVADPIMIKSDLTTGSVKEGLRMAQALGAEIVSMSFSGECDNVFCQFYYTAERYSDTFWDVMRSGVFLLAAAGNESWDARNTIPCRYNGAVFCVGALNRDDTNAADYSSFGSNVDLFSPAGIPTWGPDNSSVVVFGEYYGTSAATPYTAGVAAMLKAANPALTPGELANILTSTGRTDSADPKVTVYLSAIDAVRNVFGNRMDPDSMEENDLSTSPSERTVSSTGTLDFGDLTLDSPTDQDHLRLHLTVWASMNLTLVTPDIITEVEYVLTRIGGGIAPRRTAHSESTSGRTATFTEFAPGDYLLTIRHGHTRSTATHRETGYRLRLDFTAQPAPGADVYENNNNWSSPYNFGATRGTYNATTHTASDVDHYRFVVGSLLGTESMNFVIRNTDSPLTLTLYDSLGAQVAETTGNELTLGTGTWTVKVRQASGLISRYAFTTLGGIPPSGGSADRFSPRPIRFWRIIAELGNMDLSVIRGAEYLLIPAGPRPKEFAVYGNVDVQLMDIKGNVMAVGTGSDIGQGVKITHLPTSAVPGNEDAIIRVTPSGFDASIVDELEWKDSSFPSEPFVMTWNKP